MNEIRSYASLSGSLLARKGGAKPAMRPRPLTHGGMLDDLGWDDMGGDPVDHPGEHVPSSIAALTPAPKPAAAREEAPPPAEARVEAAPPVHVQQQAIAERFGNDQHEELDAPEQRLLSEEVVTALRAPAGRGAHRKQQARVSGKKAAFTLRLEPERHFRLRLAAAVTGQSAQLLVTAALDQFIESIPEVGTLAQRLPARGGKHS
jgi:predicted HicB family RNase H-like nuclease